jgi:hypothetical protein
LKRVERYSDGQKNIYGIEIAAENLVPTFDKEIGVFEIKQNSQTQHNGDRKEKRFFALIISIIYLFGKKKIAQSGERQNKKIEAVGKEIKAETECCHIEHHLCFSSVNQ